MLKLFTLSFICLSVMHSAAGQALQDCSYEPKKLRNICMMVSERMPDKDGRNTYLYQTRLQEAACVVSNDSEAWVQAKMQRLWREQGSSLTCNGASLDIQDGNLLKFAFIQEFDDFFRDVIKWKIDLNEVDPTDGRTLLDYVQSQIDKNAGNELGKRYQNYYYALQHAGAKRRHELMQPGR